MKLTANELRIGNWVEPITKSPCKITGVNLQKVKDGNVVFIYADYDSFLPEHIMPVELTEEWLLKFDLFPVERLEIPSWIKFVHELQNWYFWTHEKKELELTLNTESK